MVPKVDRTFGEPSDQGSSLSEKGVHSGESE